MERPLAARDVRIRLESVGERGKGSSLPSSASSCLVAVSYFLAVEVDTEALKSFSLSFLRCCGASCGRQDTVNLGPFSLFSKM